MKPTIILENIRSAYNVGNIIRTADALRWDVILSGYTPIPEYNESVKKTSLGAEESVHLRYFWNTSEALDVVKKQGYMLIAGEICERSVPLDLWDSTATNKKIVLIVGNEKTGVLAETLERCDMVVHIPMQGIKDSLNVGQAAAILMWELGGSHRENLLVATKAEDLHNFEGIFP